MTSSLSSLSEEVAEVLKSKFADGFNARKNLWLLRQEENESLQDFIRRITKKASKSSSIRMKCSEDRDRLIADAIINGTSCTAMIVQALRNDWNLRLIRCFADQLESESNETDSNDSDNNASFSGPKTIPPTDDEDIDGLCETKVEVKQEEENDEEDNFDHFLDYEEEQTKIDVKLEELTNNFLHGSGRKCKFCEESFEFLIDFKEHAWSEHRKCYCEMCNTYLLSEGSLERHKLKRHRDGKEQQQKKKFECQECHRAFAMNWILKKHVIVVHATQKNYRCHLCPKAFAIERSLRIHRENVHYNVGKFVCKTCGKGYAKSSYLARHVKMVHLQIVESICEYCSKTFTNSYSYRNHVARVHMKTKNVICQHCGRSFFDDRDLRTHVKAIHDKIVDHKCEVCGKLFGRSHTLKRHVISVHKKIRDQQCELCPKAFTLKRYLIQHVKEVHEQYRTQCDICKKDFAGFSNGNLLKHKRSVHGYVPPTSRD